ncbi:MAG: FAD-dependent monooxygenase, partial [Gammaproteobacteria bacterium]|nr:FAD-dependent monooxygenase [Gammaproteobacteria bacterium]
MAEGFREDFEVAVVGGGPVGAAAALGLADAGRRVALIEQHQPQVQVGALGMDLRTLALSPASQALLADLGLWSALKPTPYRSMQVWEERGTAAIRFEASDVDRTELGWMQENGPLAQAAWQRLGEHSNAELIVGEAPSAVEPQPDAVAIDVGDRRLRAALLIGADGAQSRVREQLGVKAQAQDTRQVALVSVVQATEGHGGTAWQRFLHDGPLALLPGCDERTAALVWSQSPAA